MSAERWRRIQELYHAAQARPANERAAFLEEACAGDATLRQAIESLLAQPVSTDDFLERPALEAAQPISTMRLAAGARLGSYEIVGLLGAGGMGEVYRARDTTLGRQVAIKVLPEAFAQDAERLALLGSIAEEQGELIELAEAAAMAARSEAAALRDAGTA